METKKENLFDELLDVDEEILSAEDIYAMISPLASEFYELEEKQKQEILAFLVEKVELYCGEIKIYLRMHKKKHPDKLEKFEEMLEWLPR